MKILGDRLLVKKLPEEEKEGFTTAQVQDDFVYKGIVVDRAGNKALDNIEKGDTILFAKYSPDTHEIDVDGEKMKIVAFDDVLAVL